MKKLALLPLSLCALLGAQTTPAKPITAICSPFQTCNCLSRMNGQPVLCPVVVPSTPVAPVAPANPPLTEPSCPAHVIGPNGASTLPTGAPEVFELCPQPLCLVSTLQNAQALMAAIAPVVTAPGAPFAGTHLQLVQTFGNYLVPPLAPPSVFSYAPINPSDLSGPTARGEFEIYTTEATPRCVVCSPLEWLIEQMYTSRAGTAAAVTTVNGVPTFPYVPGSWQYVAPYPQIYPSWKTLTYVPSN